MTAPLPPPRLHVDDVLHRYEVVLLDSYGVLVDEDGVLPGAVALIERLERGDHRWMVLSNDASRLPATAVDRYRARGLPIPPARLLTSADLIAPHFRAHGLAGRRCVVLGPPDSHTLVRDAGGQLVDPDDASLEVVVVCDDDGYPFRETLETLVSTLYALAADGRRPHLVLPNPDLVYPRGGGRFGLTAGSIARVLEGALALRYPADPPRFVPLGKPHPEIFERALARLEIRPGPAVVMIGDQLATDIAGARAMGLDAVLMATGVCDPERLPPSGPQPTGWLPGLA